MPGTRIRLTFREADLGASAGCNMIGGQYRVEGDRLVFTGGSMTEMACPDGRDAQDNWLLAILASSPTLRLAGDELTLESGTVTITLLDRTVAEPDQPLVGTPWVVVGIIDGDTASSLPSTVSASLELRAGGEIALNTGCNVGAGRWAARSNDGTTGQPTTIAISELGMTARGCLGAAGQVEAAIVRVLQAGLLSVQIEGRSLTLTSRTGDGLQLEAPGLGEEPAPSPPEAPPRA